MKNLFVLSSPRKNGNSETMARIVASQLVQSPGNTIEFVSLNTLNIRPCQACGGCLKDGVCIREDDMTPLYQKTDMADRVFFVSPIYFYALNAQLKAYIDRFQALWARKYILNRPHRTNELRTGHLISCAATNGNKLFSGATLTIKCLCDTLDLHYGEALLLRNLEGPDALTKETDKIQHCKSYASKILLNTI